MIWVNVWSRWLQVEELRREIAVLDDRKAAFEKVIKVYEPGFEVGACAGAGVGGGF